jgi:Ca2+/Na+ antiporter
MLLVDPLHVTIALGPLATYLVVLGLINLSSRPLVTSGARDAAALAIAIAGLVVAGPMELFLVEEAVALYGSLVWAIMLAAYALFVVLIILLQRPRVVVYNITLEQLRPLLADVVSRLDGDARWAGESLMLPQLGVQLHLEFAPMLQNVQLISAGPEQNLAGWKRLEKELVVALRKSRQRANLFGVLATGMGLFMAAGITYLLVRDPGEVLHALNEMLRR